jgi:MarR family transcriptional regulator, negative regulator of the multidrug operon emrRAB
MGVSQVVRLEAGLRRIGGRVPAFPVQEALTLRLVALLARGLAGRLDDALAGTALSEVEFRALMVLFSRDETETTPSDLSDALAQSPAGVTRITDQLQALGLITRTVDAADRRRVLLHLTSAGEQQVGLFLPAMSQSIEALFDGVAPADRHRLQQSLRQLCLGLEALPRATSRSSP